MFKNGTGLSLPASIVRTTIGPSGVAASTSAYEADCASTEGCVWAERYRSSVRNRPTPSASACAALTASSTEPMFERTGTIGSRPVSTKVIAWVADDMSPPKTTRSPTGSTKTKSPFSKAAASPQETTAGIERERQMIAVCEVGPPLSVMTPTTAGVNCAVSAGEKSSPTITNEPEVGSSKPTAMPARLACTRFEISCKSLTRSSKSGSPPSSSANSSTALPYAAPAVQPSAR